MNVTLLAFSIAVMIINAIEIALLIKGRRILSNFEKMMFSLSVADLLVGFTQALTSILKLCDTDTKALKFNSLLLFTIAASFNHVNAITADRYLAICWPIKHRIWNTPRTATIVISCLWLANIIMLTPLLANDSLDYIRRILAIMTFLYIALMCFAYAFIVYRAIICRRKSFRGESNASAAQAKKDLQLVFVSVGIVVTFIVCTLPLAITVFIYEELPKPAKVMILLNSLFNPFIYFFWKFSERRSRRNQDSAS